MNTNEGLRRIAGVFQLLGFVALLLGVAGLIHQTEQKQILIAIVAIVCASPFFAVAWIVDGFVSREQRQLDAMLAQWRRNAEMGRRALDRHPKA